MTASHTPARGPWRRGWLALQRVPQGLLVALVRVYRLLLKPWLGNVCRFEPTCSSYALQALQRHGAVVGGTLAVGRLLRCHPWCAGGHDAVPEHAPRLFTRFFAKTRP
jgi:putative membrane protein insertion efficiency factor